MKKIFLFLLIFAVATPAMVAQKVTSDSRVIKIEREQKVKKELNIKNCWLVKVGGGINYNKYCDDDNVGTYNVALGYNHILNSHGLYVGGQLGANRNTWTENYKYHATSNSIYLGPVLGLKKIVGTSQMLDFHFGVNVNHVFNAYDEEHRNALISSELGAGLWYRRFLIELQYRAQNLNDGYITHQFVVNFGYRF